MTREDTIRQYSDAAVKHLGEMNNGRDPRLADGIHDPHMHKALIYAILALTAATQARER